ncbi:hypothetical protein [Chitinophaga sp. YIM B06452]|uniref:hypothetical protein n=1 Tax=Chitinophaga sp. YIM B06452 TaxID=3082158 RepID=UPI0031FE9318
MKKILFGFAALTLVVMGACKKEGKPEDRGLQAGVLAVCDTVVLPNVISGSMTLTNDKVYILNGKTYVASGGILTINAGTRIEGIRKDSAKDASALVITKGGKINANGDSCNPIVFTTRINGSNAVANPGDWGGIVILGKSIVNKVNPVIEGIDLPTLPPGIDVTYGGTDSLDNSGTIKFVRIEYAGAVVAPNKELNSLTLGGVGSQTTIHHVEAAWGADDAFEFFGGTVNASYLVALAMNDDGLDFDYGYRGAIQFALVVRSSCCFNQTYADANGIECDNDEFDNSGALPKTRPILSNITIVGGQNAAIAGTLNGVRFRRSADYIMRNSVVMGYGDGTTSYGARFDAPSVKTEFKYNIIHAFGANNTNVPPLDATNVTAATTGGVGLLAPFNCGASGTGLNFAPANAASLPIANAANFVTGWPANIIPTANNFLNKTVTYRGAFAQANRNWLGCWSNCIGFLPPAMNCQ